MCANYVLLKNWQNGRIGSQKWMSIHVTILICAAKVCDDFIISERVTSEATHAWVNGFQVYSIKVDFTLEQAMKAQRWSRGIALFFL